MKISTFTIFVLIISGFFFTYALMVEEANNQFEDTGLNSSAWEDQYDYIDDINETFSPLEQSLKILQDDEAGWFDKIQEGLAAVPYVLIIVPETVFGSLVFGGEIVVAFFQAWNLPAKIVSLGLVLLLVWAIFKLIEYFNKTEI